MNAPMTNTLLNEIDAFLDETGMAESTFGRSAVNDWKLIDDLRGKNRKAPRRLWPETEVAVRAFMAAHRNGSVS